MSKTLHDYIAQMRPKIKEWVENNPGVHMVEIYEMAAREVVKQIKKDGQAEVYVHPAPGNGGIPLYTFAIALLEENGIRVLFKDTSQSLVKSMYEPREGI